MKVRVGDVDAAFARTRDCSARVLAEPTTYEYGEPSCVVEDLAGHRWELTQTVRDVARGVRLSLSHPGDGTYGWASVRGFS